jgi:hypothetical protein
MTDDNDRPGPQAPAPPDHEALEPAKANRYRVFLSYSHEDQKLAEGVIAVLKDQFEPLWDRHIRPGSAFTESIKGLIVHAHVFMPLITPKSKERPWVHQETGFAMALNIPVLPLASGDIPAEMLAQLQAINVDPQNIAELPERLRKLGWEFIVSQPLAKAHLMTELADFPEARAKSMFEHANRILELGYRGRVYQRGGLSSFSIPRKDFEDPIWALRDGPNRRSDYLHYWLAKERDVLERHAREAGCTLIIDPEVPKNTWSKQDDPDGQKRRKFLEARCCRLTELRGFLDDMSDEQVRVICSPRAREANITTVGDWFLAESRLRHDVEGWRQTFFNWYAPEVLQAVRQFEQLADDLMKDYAPAPNSSRSQAIHDVDRVLETVARELDGRNRLTATA